MTTKAALPTLAATEKFPLILLVAALGVVTVAPGQHTRASSLARAAILGGGLGNISDMLLFGYIRDVFTIGPVAYNGADLAIAAGLVAWLTIQLRVVYSKRTYGTDTHY